MKKREVYSLCEALADITQIATQQGFYTPNSRDRVALYIQWAREFERMHQGVLWGEDSPCEYLDAIHHFTAFKLHCHQHQH